MSRLFAKAKKAPSVMEVLAELTANCEELTKREDHYKHKIQEEKAIILANGKKNLSVSMRAMKKVKNYERQIQSIHSIMDNLEELKSQIAAAEMNQRTMEVYKKASSFLKNNQMSIDRVDATMDDIREGVETFQEIQDAITTPLGTQVHDEDELAAELDELLAQAEEEQQVHAPPAAVHVAPEPEPFIPSMPSVPRVPLPSKSDEEAALARLQAEMGMA